IDLQFAVSGRYRRFVFAAALAACDPCFLARDFRRGLTSSNAGNSGAGINAVRSSSKARSAVGNAVLPGSMSQTEPASLSMTDFSLSLSMVSPQGRENVSRTRH